MAFGYLTPFRSRTPATTGTGGSLFDLHRQVNRLFDDLFDQDGDSGFYARAGMATPAMDIHQDDKQVEITAELPGVKEEDIDITIDDGVLTLRGEKESTREDEQSGYRERSYGSFERRITLPANIDEDACSADFRDGVLTITLPKSEEKARGRKIQLGQGQRGSRAEDQLIEQRTGATRNEQKANEREKESA
jgi:HSP20 family protein